MTISPNFGAIGAPQFGHLIEVAPCGAMTALCGALFFDCVSDAEDALLTGVPHFEQKAASSGICAPHFRQYNRFQTPILELRTAVQTEL